MRRLYVLMPLLCSVACARVMAPSGGDRDQEPPRVIETEPAQNLIAMNFANTTRAVRIVFDETISERSPREMVQVSPETGEIHVDRDGNVLDVTIEGGWREGQVYRVTVLPGILDRHGNARTVPYELVFSTGGAMHANALGGIATDRITGRPVPNARVEARLTTDTATVYTAVSDSAGFFAMRSLPIGDYRTSVYVDQNRNRVPDRTEARADSTVKLAATDTLVLELALLARDTTPARLLRADIRDSAQVRLHFDDYMEAGAPRSSIIVTAWQFPDSTVVPTGALLTPRLFQASRGDTARTSSPRLPQPADSVQLPINELVWVPAVPLRPTTRYRFTVTGYTNLQGIGGGGGSVTATSPAPPRSAPRDTTAARRDTTATPRDTTGRR